MSGHWCRFSLEWGFAIAPDHALLVNISAICTASVNHEDINQISLSSSTEFLVLSWISPSGQLKHVYLKYLNVHLVQNKGARAACVAVILSAKRRERDWSIYSTSFPHRKTHPKSQKRKLENSLQSYKSTSQEKQNKTNTKPQDLQSLIPPVCLSSSTGWHFIYRSTIAFICVIPHRLKEKCLP